MLLEEICENKNGEKTIFLKARKDVFFSFFKIHQLPGGNCKYQLISKKDLASFWTYYVTNLIYWNIWCEENKDFLCANIFSQNGHFSETLAPKRQLETSKNFHENFFASFWTY